MPVQTFFRSVLLDMVFFVVMPDEAVWVFDGFLQPFEVQLRLFLVAELPLHVGAVHPFDEMRQDDGGGVGDVEAFGEAVHRDEDVAVGVFYRLVGKARQFGAEQEGGFLLHGQVEDGATPLVGQRGGHPVALLVQPVDALLDVVLAVRVFGDGEPLVGPHADVFVRFEVVAMLDHVHVLHAVAVARPQHRADVLRLEKVFQHHRDVARAVLYNLGQPGLPTIRDELLQILHNLVSQCLVFYLYHTELQ